MAKKSLQDAAFGAGCFWGVEELYRKIPGVKETEVGYMGGHTENPTYEEVCSDATGHAETVHLKYDPDEVSYKELLKLFWENHDPTQVNRQGSDVGTQYRSIIFTYTDEQKKEAAASKKKIEASGTYTKPLATEIVPAKPFYRAEEYHQKYLKKKGLNVCHT